ncbi:MAG: type II toxin-antitoxin system HicB family antitoxin [Spirochaetaceae bacterium]|jgi:predicted RNase H-like HicB family nuclease|nr:type II toxin-antitoxin system HicB family antitoxin [Spirochaetaceae bacterium]
MQKYTYYAVFEPSTDGSYGVYWPDLPGCTSWGENLPRAQEMAKEALTLHLSQMIEDGDRLPVSQVPSGGNTVSRYNPVMPVTVFVDANTGKFNTGRAARQYATA